MTLGTLLLLLVIVHSVILSVAVVLERRNPSAGLAWIGTLIFLPGVGVAAYWLIGRRRVRRRARWRGRTLEHRRNLAPPSPSLNRPSLPNPQQRIVMRLGARLTGGLATTGNRVRLLRDARQTYPEMIRAIQGAQKHVLLESYIFRNDGVGKDFIAALTDAAARGVQTYVLVDGVGTWRTFLSAFRELEAQGGKVAVFAPIRLPLFSDQLNFRNHRKILVVDGTVGFTGGLNIGEEYIGLDPSIGHWRDNHMCIRGPAVSYLQQVVLEDWFFATNDVLEHIEFADFNEHPGNATVQIIPSGPDLEWRSVQQVLLRAMAGAMSRIFITSPYFIPDEATLNTLVNASLSGIDVRLLVPRKSDLRLVLWAGRSYYLDLLNAGVTIYEYESGFIHAKSYVVDDWMASVGSANMDIRSFQLNFEVNAFVFDEEFAATMATQFFEDLKHAREVTVEEYQNRPFLYRFGEGVARLVSPLL